MIADDFTVTERAKPGMDIDDSYTPALFECIVSDDLLQVET